MEKSFQKISTADLYLIINEPNTVIVDIRPVDAYNGWKLQNEQRGGHIKGARSLPLKWSNYIDWIEIVRSKNILPEHHLVIYSYKPEDAEKIAELFTKAGYQHISIYNHFVDEWCADEKYPMEHLARYKQLVSPQWLKNLLDGKKPAEYDNNKYVICHSHYRNRADYELDHIPGAVDLDTLLLESPETWNRRSPAELKKALEEKGITSDTTVVLYGRF